MERRNGNGSEDAAVDVAGGWRAEATKQQNKFYCTEDHIRKLAAEIRAAGLQLRGTSADTQLTTLPKVLEYLGPRGLNTYEAMGLGYLRVATRIKELRQC